MDGDKEVEGELAQLERQLNCMGTEDEETLVRQFQQLLAPHADLSPDLCRFFLDMNSWNLQEALGCFYDYNAQQMIFHSLPSMQLVADITVGEGESVAPNSRFVKTWRIRNNGNEQWTLGCCMRHIDGDLLADVGHVEVEPLRPGEMTDVSVTMTSPAQQGTYQSRWRMFTGAGLPFGETIWCIIIVDNSGLLELTQRLASANCSGSQQAQWSFGNDQMAMGASGDGISTGNELHLPRNPFQSGIRHDEALPHVSGLATVSAHASTDGLSRPNVIALPYGQVNSETTAGFSFERPMLGDMRPNEFASSTLPASRINRMWQGWDGTAAAQSNQPTLDRWSGRVSQPNVSSVIDDDDSPEEGGKLGITKLRPGALAPALNSMSAVSVVQPLQPLYGPPSTDDDMDN